MNKIEEFDLFLREKFMSVFYRITTVLYGLFIITTNDNYLEFYYYYIALLVYLLIYFKFIGKNGYFAVLLLLNDILLIGFIIFKKNLDVVNSCYLILPLINFSNYWGNLNVKFSLVIVMLFTYLLYFFLFNSQLKENINIVFFRKFNFPSRVIIPISTISFISLFSYYRNMLTKYFYSLNSDLINLFDNVPILKEYRIFSSIIQRLNESKLNKMFIVNDIYCLSVEKKNNNVSVYQGSKFIKDFEIPNKALFLKKILNQVAFTDYYIIINGKLIEYNICISIDNDNYLKVFIIDIEIIEGNFFNKFSKSDVLKKIKIKSKSISSYLLDLRNKYILTPVLVPFFSRINTILIFQKKRKADFIRSYDNIKKEHIYVIRTIHVMHFVRGKLSPFRGLIEILINESIDKKIDDLQIRELITRDLQTSKNSIRDINRRANQILDDTINPFNLKNSLVVIKLQNIISRIREQVNENLKSDNINLEIPVDRLKEIKLSVSNIGIEFVINDIITNISKHYYKEYSINVRESNNEIHILFENDLKPTTNLEELKDIVKFIDSDKIYGIFKMKTKGIFLIKDYLKQMGVDLRAHIKDDNKYSLLLIFLPI